MNTLPLFDDFIFLADTTGICTTATADSSIIEEVVSPPLVHTAVTAGGIPSLSNATVNIILIY